MLKLILNSATLLLVLIINYLSNSGAFNAKTVGEVSRKYDTLFTPAGYAFSIWGLIYILLLIFVVYQWYVWLSNHSKDIINRTGLWFALANAANALWVLVWTNEYVGVSVILMLILLFSLIQLVIRLNLERYDAPLSIILFVWWPLTFYFGWIILATTANIAAFLVSIGWEGGPFFPEIWTIILILISAAIYALLILTRNMREAALVGIWGLAAIAYRQWDTYNQIALTALVAAACLFIYISWHGYKNRSTSPLNKWKNRKNIKANN